uniref:SLAM family member 5 n=1 Tax=Ailuropoda melanoleuca TaxID=9646 RepID=A0A7N5JTK7_AILME
ATHITVILQSGFSLEERLLIHTRVQPRRTWLSTTYGSCSFACKPVHSGSQKVSSCLGRDLGSKLFFSFRVYVSEFYLCPACKPFCSGKSALGLEAARSDTDILTVIGIVGESVTFPLNIEKSQQVVNIVWNSETSVAFVTPGDPGTAPKVSVTHQNYNERINVSCQNYNLEIRNLRLEDSGVYKADINTKTVEGMVTTTRRYSLQVFRRLGKPKITQSLMTSRNSTCNVTLICSVEKEEENVTYSWSPLGEEGNVIRIFQTPDSQELTYTCTAWNPVSNSSDSISAQQLCADTATGLRTRHTGLLSGLAVLFLLILIAPSVLLFLLCKRGQGRIFPEGTMWKCTCLLPGTEVIYPRGCREVLCSGKSAFLQPPLLHVTISRAMTAG